MFVAAKRGQAEVLQLLVDAKADINAVNNNNLVGVLVLCEGFC